MAATSKSWLKLFPILLLRVRIAPKDILQLSPLEMLYARPFLISDLFINPEIQDFVKHLINLGQVQ
jgi:hypothetical protein